jgi:dihydroorotate dehydrogenase electron transfer subunit
MPARHPAEMMTPSSPSVVHDQSSRVSENRDLGSSHYLLTLEAEAIASAASPGQFVMLRFPGSLDPFLPRPMSVCNAMPPGNGQGGRIQILHKIVGRGTRRLSLLRPGEQLQVLGPLGKPFEPPPGPPGRLALMVAGGIGIAIFPFLAGLLKRSGWRCRLLFGARSSSDLIHRDWFEGQGVEVRVATEDGSEGRRGFVTPLLEEALASDPAAMIYACGPMAMLGAVAQVSARAGVPAQLSLESYMGCGIGACLGCVVKVRGQEGWAYRRICVEGPTFLSDEVVWE